MTQKEKISYFQKNLDMQNSIVLKNKDCRDTEKTIERHVVDIYRREGNKLAENWIFIDLLYFLMQQGVDVLNRTKKIVNI